MCRLFALLNETYTGKDSDHKSTLPINIVLFKKADVEAAESLHTGAAVPWEGKLARRTYEKEGTEKAVFAILMQDLAQSWRR